MAEKARTTITVDERILKMAKEEGINVSGAAERGIIEALRNKKSVLEPEKYNLGENISSNPDSKEPSKNIDSDEVVRGVGFEPTYPCGTAPSTLRR